MEIGKTFRREITDEMKEAYLDYAMSVIVSRALPDVRDGLKPVQRRILYAMHELGLGPQAKFRKSALVIGDVLGKYHPHGDVAVYDALVRMAQPFSLRYPLIEGQGNFGSVDGDPPAAMRYTEVKLAPIAEALLADIEKDTVTFVPNYDASRKEPAVLPAALPNLLLNGSVGIAVGMATAIPPHNLREVVDALQYLISHPDATTEELCQFIQGPDFPTGGMIFDKKAIIEAYATGRGSIVMRGKAEIEEGKRGYMIVIREIPYEVNKAELISKIALLAEEKKIEGIRDVRDESDKEGLRIVVELKQDAYSERVLEQLYRLSDLERAYHFNMLALVDGIQPQILSLPAILGEYLEYRQSVVRRRTEFDLSRTKARIHILEGLSKALTHIDAVIKTIKQAENRQDAKEKLMRSYDLSDAQAEAILEMKLSQLAKLERSQIQSELEEKRKLAKELAAILKDPKKLNQVISNELEELKKRYGDERRTEVRPEPLRSAAQEEIYIPQEETIVTLSRSGYIKRMKPSAIRAQRRGGKGVIGFEVKLDEDAVKLVQAANTHDILFFFTNVGRVFKVNAYEIPEASRTSRGKLIKQFLNLNAEEAVNAIVPVKRQSESEGYVVLGTKKGIMKRIKFSELRSASRRGIVALKVKKDDALMWAGYSTGTNDIIAVSSQGQAIRFSEKELRPMARNAQGVTGMKLRSGDELIGMGVVPTTKDNASKSVNLLVVTKNGFGKQTALKNYRLQRRGGVGIKTAKITSKTGPLVGALVRRDEKELVAASVKGQTIRVALDSIPILSRATQGVKIMKLEDGDSIASIAIW
jgi:DNA gyrase subunit A